ncbi:glycoside hydrolase family 88 protein [Klebsiella grimontii]|uniref:glycoside hydrolase family 88 protein n=1 Tax=Klebsiella grimontii TaxID=2058152 RepID=UPI0019141D94|nr:glycoside hydrolase family 88 protein [Klebsiella grimontii]
MKESLSNRLTPLPFPALTPDACRDELTACARRIARNMGLYGEKFPSACTLNNRYVLKENNDWTNGFWTGMQAMAWEFSGDRAYLDGVERNVASFKARLAAHYVLDHHDIGFLYSLSAVAYWKLTEREALTPLILAAADLLVNRFHHSAGFIQAWGMLNDPQEYRLIIDSLINLPLLHVAAKISGESRYREVAERHYAAVINNIFREDGSTFHTFYFDQTSGAPSHGKTFQGYSDNSCWARGQAWAILGIPLHWSATGKTDHYERWRQACEYFFRYLPEDGVPAWDLLLAADPDAPKDSSALAIAVCGLLEAHKHFPDAGYQTLARQCLLALMRGASAREDDVCEGLLKHGVYAYALGKGIDECNLWGDYFYMEALYRVYQPQWSGYWL